MPPVTTTLDYFRQLVRDTQTGPNQAWDDDQLEAFLEHYSEQACYVLAEEIFTGDYKTFRVFAEVPIAANPNPGGPFSQGLGTSAKRITRPPFVLDSPPPVVYVGQARQSAGFTLQTYPMRVEFAQSVGTLGVTVRCLKTNVFHAAADALESLAIDSVRAQNWVKNQGGGQMIDQSNRATPWMQLAREYRRRGGIQAINVHKV